MKILWLTDLHLDHLEGDGYGDFLRSLDPAPADACVVTGDVSAASTFARHLAEIHDELGEMPTYFVLGNHDFYGSTIERTRRAAANLRTSRPKLRYLFDEFAPVRLTERTLLVGHDGWADGRFGAYDPKLTHDCDDIGELKTLKGASPEMCAGYCRKLGEEAAEHVRVHLQSAFAVASHVVLATHVPPFPEASRYRGGAAEPSWLAHTVCGAVGDAIREEMAAGTGRRLTVLCGHTHHRWTGEPIPGVTVSVGAAKCGRQPEKYFVEID